MTYKFGTVLESTDRGQNGVYVMVVGPAMLEPGAMIVALVLDDGRDVGAWGWDNTAYPTGSIGWFHDSAWRSHDEDVV